MVVRRRRRFSKLNAFYFLATLGLMVGGSLWMDKSAPALGKVSGKFEEITLSYTPQGAWYRWYRVGVVFDTPDNGQGSATVSVDQDRYDALEVGDTIAVRYLAAFPLIARAANRTTSDVVRELGRRVVSDSVLAPLLLWLGIGVLGLVIAMRVSTAVIFVVAALWIAIGFPLLLPAPRAVTLGSSVGQARVVAISLVDRAPERRTSRRRRYGTSAIRRLKVPYQIVQLRVPLQGQSDSVLAVDAVDSGSTPGLVHNALLSIRYAAPRDARLTNARRTFLANNRYHFRVPVVGAGILGAFAAWGWRDRRVKRRRSNGNAGA